MKVSMQGNWQTNLDTNNGKKNLYNTPVGVRKWMREFRDLNVHVGFETKKMKMERTRMLSSEGYDNIRELLSNDIYIYIIG